MCGIAGWVDFERDLTHERDVLRSMTSTMACRGPDDEGYWIAPSAALGHRRLAVIDLEGGRQPMAVEEEGEARAVITYSGEVYNYLELRAELEACGQRFRTASDTEVVLRAYLQWGEGFLDRLNGMYAFALWDPAARALLLVRDRMGIKPLFYAPTSAGVLFGSEPKALLAHPDVTPVVGLDGLREVLSFWFKTPGHGIYRGLREVEPGTVVRVDPGGSHVCRYWRLEAAEHEHDRETTVATVRELLEDIVAHQLRSDVPLCALLSGGLDSSAITALAQRTARGNGPVRSFAVDYVGYAERFQPDGQRVAPDTPFAHELAAYVGTNHSDVVLEAGELASRVNRDAVLRANDRPMAAGDLYTSLHMLFRGVREHATVALSGESADEVFGGYVFFHDPASVWAETFPWCVALGRSTDIDPVLLDPALAARLDLAGHCERSYRTALERVPRLPGEGGLERRMREVSHLSLTQVLPILLDRKDRMSMACGLEVRVPFCDHRLVQYVFNAPWSLKSFDGREKSLLRAAVGDLLPRSILERRKSVFPTTQEAGYERFLRGELAELLERGDFPARPLLDARALPRLLAEPLGDVSLSLARHDLEVVLGLNRWLELTGARLDLDGWGG